MRTFVLFILLPVILSAQVKPGIDVLADEGFAVLKGKRVGLITNPTGMSSRFVSTADLLASAPSVKLVALYAPEHGVRGDVTAGGKVDAYTDPATGVPVHSLYGRTRKPTPEMLKGVEVLVYDIQDIGSRSYTFINTMAYAMEAAAEQGIDFVVLDRPNPLGGVRVEGNILDTAFRSFVGQYPIPYVYGMTCGEFAAMLNGEGWLAGGRQCRLTVVPMRNWKRSMLWKETGLPWVPTSPHVPDAPDALYYSSTGIIGELETVNIGVGYTMPFQLAGAEWIDGTALAAELNSRGLRGVRFRPLFYKPYYGKQQGKLLQGVQLHLTDPAAVDLTALNIHILEALIRLHPDRNPFVLADSSRLAMFDKVMGTDTVRKRLTAGERAERIMAGWGAERSAFMKAREKYLRYE